MPIRLIAVALCIALAGCGDGGPPDMPPLVAASVSVEPLGASVSGVGARHTFAASVRTREGDVIPARLPRAPVTGSAA